MRLFYVFLMTMAVSACGFHLRGQTPGVPKAISVSSKVHGAPLVFELRKALEQQGRLAEADKALAHIQIGKSQWQRQLLAIDHGERSRVVRLRIDYALYKTGEKDSAAIRNIEIERSLFTSDLALLNSEARVDELKQRMRREAIRQMIGELQTLGLNK